MIIATSRVLDINSRLYSIIVSRYPISLRARYESDMQDVFRDQMRDALLESGFAGLGRTWLAVAAEMFALALPCCFRASVIGVISIASSLLLFYIFSSAAAPFDSSMSCAAEIKSNRHLSSTRWATGSHQKAYAKVTKIEGYRLRHSSEPL